MDSRPDTSGSASERIRDQQWSFLQTDLLNAVEVPYTHSHPPSSYEYLRSDRSIVSPLTISLSHIGGNASFSRPSSRYLTSASTGARSSASTPSHPVLLRINSANSHNHTNPAPRRNRTPIEIIPETGLPALKEFSMQGILSAIQEDIEGDLNIISEILGRSRFVLADQHESHLPPQGEITGSRVQSPLPGIDEAPFGAETLVFDNVMIAHEDGSLIDGSNSGSAAYGLLERFQITPRTTVIRPSNDATNILPTVADESEMFSERLNPSTEAVPSSNHTSEAFVATSTPEITHGRRGILQIERGPSQAIVSETFLDAEANGTIAGSVPVVTEAGRYYPLYSYDDTRVLEPAPPLARPLPRTDESRANAENTFSVFSSWFSNPRASTDQRIETRLRSLLNR